ncbi:MULTISPECIES: sensor histidine kinase [unclassified Sphingomonas]|uniref:sensor histidine kinase n=1 Tax=unclassified Sphingomonas TaxID=196159 RepID=UPI000ADD89D7|nr:MULTISPECIES: PAS domain-containing protein [unclassified Sphingomonas]
MTTLDSVPATAVFDEAERSRVIAAYDVAGARAKGQLDDIVAFAAELCAAPVALLSLVEDEYQRFLSRTGTDLEQTPRSMSFCAHAMHHHEVMEVADTLEDPRFVDNALVTGPPYVRFYAGAPLVSSEGVPLGALCVLAPRPREGLTRFQRDGMTLLAKAAMGRLDDRRSAREQAMADAEARRTLEASDLKFRTLADTMPQMVWSTLPDGFHDYFNARWYEFTGTPVGTTDGEGWNDMFHPEDQDRAWSVWRQSLDSGEPYNIEYRLRHYDGTYRWVLGRALPVRDENGTITRWFGTCTDIHEQKLAYEEREVISQELSHRIKNIFAVIAGLIAFSARGKPEFMGIATDLRHRINALGRAHDFVRPHSANSRPAAAQNSLHGLLHELFEPYQRIDGARLNVTGDDVTIDDRSATPLALLFHELATNATKYGALATELGTVRITIAANDDSVTLLWREVGGPAVTKPTMPAGFGTQLIEMSAVRQLGGTVNRIWNDDGLVVELTIPKPAFSR